MLFRSQMTFFLHRFRKLDMTQEKHRQALIDTFVNAVFVHDDKILIGYNFQDGTRTITLTDVQTATDESGSDLEMFGASRRKGLEQSKCGADERRRRRLDGAEP